MIYTRLSDAHLTIVGVYPPQHVYWGMGGKEIHAADDAPFRFVRVGSWMGERDVEVADLRADGGIAEIEAALAAAPLIVEDGDA